MPANDELEAWLLAVAQRADRQAFSCLFLHYAPRIKGFMLRAGCPADLADEIAQETLVVLWRKAAQFDPTRAAVSTWVFTIARNIRIDMHRRQHGAGEAVEFDPAQLDGDTESRGDGPDDLLSTSQRARRLREAIARLPDEQALVLRLSFLEEHPHAQIARALDLPLGTVKSRIRLAVGRLRDLLNEFET